MGFVASLEPAQMLANGAPGRLDGDASTLAPALSIIGDRPFAVGVFPHVAVVAR